MSLLLMDAGVGGVGGVRPFEGSAIANAPHCSYIHGLYIVDSRRKAARKAACKVACKVHMSTRRGAAHDEDIIPTYGKCDDYYYALE